MDWSLLGWGALIGAIGVAGSYAVGRRAHLERNTWRAYPGFIALSAAVAVLAAALGSGWLVVGFAAYVAVANFAVPLLLIPRLRRRASHTCASDSSCGAEACATCPLSTHPGARSHVT